MKRFIITAACIALAISARPCTNLLAGKNASTDGSTMISYSADSYCLYGELYHRPAAVYPAGTMLDVYDWDTGRFLGKIPQARQTYNVTGNMNEHQLCIGETTFTGRPELQDTTGVLDYGSLIYIALQRCTTAREAIRVMTDLTSAHGYYSTGESFSIADKNEVWMLELIGKGPGRKGAVWVAARIPDDCIAAHANQARIHQFPLNDSEHFLYSEDVISFAREKGYFSGNDSDFSFANAYAPTDFEARRFCEARVWSFFNRFFAGAGEWVSYALGDTDAPMPLYVKPDRKISLRDMMLMMRDHYEGTPLDPTLDIGAGPFHAPVRFSSLNWKSDSTDYFFERPIATQQTGFSFVGQMRSHLPDAVGGVLWFGVDDATFTVYTPMYACMTRVPECYRTGNGDFNHFSWTSAFWIHNWVANMAYSRYNLFIADTQPVQDRLENGFIDRQASIEAQAVHLSGHSRKKAVAFLTEYSIARAQQAFSEWKSLGEKLLVKYIDGTVKKQDDRGDFQTGEYGRPAYPGRPPLDAGFRRKIAEDTGEKLKVRK
jgi:dipeptidase